MKFNQNFVEEKAIQNVVYGMFMLQCADDYLVIDPV